MFSKLANLISIFLHPLLLTSILFALLFGINSPVVSPITSASRPFLLITFLVTFIIPVMSISVLRLSKTISNFTLEDRKERRVPFLFISVFYATASWMFIDKINPGPAINVIFLSISGIIIALTAITFFWKISAHGAGVGGFIGFLVAFHLKAPQNELIWLIIASVLLSGFLMSARLYLNVHKPKEVHVGGILGFLISFLAILIFA